MRSRAVRVDDDVGHMLVARKFDRIAENIGSEPSCRGSALEVRVQDRECRSYVQHLDMSLDEQPHAVHEFNTAGELLLLKGNMIEEGVYFLSFSLHHPTAYSQ